jgi:hypothetical protein
MRSIHKGILITGGVIAWIVVMYLGPTFKTELSVFFYGGISIFGFVLIFWLGAEVTNRGAPGVSFPGYRTTINPTEAFDTISLPGVPEDHALSHLKCFALGGNPYILTKGGGPDNSYLVCPEDCVEKWDGDPSQFWFNSDLKPYRLTPKQGETPLSDLPKEVKFAVMRHPKWTKNCVVMYGVYKHQERGLSNKELDREWEGRDEYQNRHIETLETIIKKLRHQLSTEKEKRTLYGNDSKQGFMEGVMMNERR